MSVYISIHSIQYNNSNYFRANGAPIRTVNIKRSIIKPHVQELWLKEVDPSLQQLRTTVMVSDSSQYKSFIYEAEELQFVEEFLFTADESVQSSSLRELLAIHRVCSEKPEFFDDKYNQQIIWVTDSQVLWWFLHRGSRIPAIQKLILDIKDCELAFNINITPYWLSRNSSLIHTADFGSKYDRSKHEWGIDHQSYIKISEILQIYPTIDALASDQFSKCSLFFSKIPTHKAMATDFFMQKLSTEHCYFLCPSIELISSSLDKILSYSGITCLYTIPYWRSAVFWPQFTKLGAFKSFIKQYTIYQPKFISSSKECLFHESKNFSMIAFKIITD